MIILEKGEMVPVSGLKFFSEWDQDQYLKCFLAGRETQNDWFHSCLDNPLLF